jgi:hypothetical protein
MSAEIDQAQEVAAAVLFMTMKQMIDSGVPHLKALRAATVELLQGTYGSAVWKELGMNTRTVERWRAELREAMAQAPEISDEPPAAALESFGRLTSKKAG